MKKILCLSLLAAQLKNEEQTCHLRCAALHPPRISPRLICRRTSTAHIINQRKKVPPISDSPSAVLPATASRSIAASRALGLDLANMPWPAAHDPPSLPLPCLLNAPAAAVTAVTWRCWSCRPSREFTPHPRNNPYGC